ncbi:Substrate binding domain of ABC-type glycine betaine transport system [Streptomyces sp. yr375]|uniref:glycine betaine ABC transporter substrate-binding protein n=1 Tax=Streptomyces sp. yr375 TaxID=1761906 RepID=UPI0008CBA940|nr:glycine betaine ABC transporter substrate-binding protein [Streptomyces sp. yr375]SEQ43400.1 Substrate binding domain of ABC-type glycine betaine transport system [Streptomyces sp. yr375]
MTPGTRLRLRIAAATVCSLLLLTGCAAGAGDNPDTGYADREGPTVIGTDGSAESRVTAALYGELLTAAGTKVRIATTRYATPADTAKAVVEGEIGLAPSYESTLLRALPGGQTMPGNMAATLSMALPPGIVALPPAAAQRGLVLAVTRATSRRLGGPRSFADLKKSGDRLTLGGSASGAADAPSVSALAQAYGLTLAAAPASSAPDVLVLRSTDPAITRGGLVVLADPKEVAPPEHVFPLAGAPYADLTARNALARVNPLLTTEQLAVLAASVSSGEAPAKVATAWLRSKGLLG